MSNGLIAGNSGAAEVLGVPPSVLRNRLKKCFKGLVTSCRGVSPSIQSGPSALVTSTSLFQLGAGWSLTFSSWHIAPTRISATAQKSATVRHKAQGTKVVLRPALLIVGGMR
jgi:hypothetical protein